MGEADTEMQRWCDEALAVMGSILDAAALVQGATDAGAGEDALRDAVRHADRWKVMHPCPDFPLGEGLAHLVDTWSEVVGQNGDDGGPEEPRPVEPDQRQRRIKELTGDTVRLQAKLEAELLPGQ
jgi:hypothetical protein